MEIDKLVDYSNAAVFDSGCAYRWEVDSSSPEVCSRMSETDFLPEYTTDDVTEHNDDVGWKDWFKYGRMVYSMEKVQETLESLRQENTDFSKVPSIRTERGYPVYNLRKAGIVKQKLRLVLGHSIVGYFIETDVETQLSKFKECVKNLLNDLNKPNQSSEASDTICDLKDNLEQWLKDYPNVESQSHKHPVNCVDINDNFFLLPVKVMCNPSLLRPWIEEWEPFDCVIPEEGVWETPDKLDEELDLDLEDTNELFENMIKARVDESLDDFVTDIEGEAAWDVIEENVVINDKTTTEQDRIWEQRGRRRSRDTPDWTRKRRQKIADRLVQRYNWKQNKVEPFLSFCDNLEEEWTSFQSLCSEC